MYSFCANDRRGIYLIRDMGFVFGSPDFNTKRIRSHLPIWVLNSPNASVGDINSTSFVQRAVREKTISNKDLQSNDDAD